MNLSKHLRDFYTGKIEAGAKAGAKAENANPLVTGLEYDSRKIKPGNMFFALPGIHVQGAAFIADAVKRGASVVVFQEDERPGVVRSDIRRQTSDVIAPVYIAVPDVRAAMSSLAAAFYGNPSAKLCVIGVTGTEGKSTTVSLIWQLLKLLGKKAGFVSTVEYCDDGGEALPNPEHQTTPEATAVHQHLRAMLDAGCGYCVLESSSHGLSKRTSRLADVHFSVGVMTNVTYEHMEFHKTWEQYRSDKANLFRALDNWQNSDTNGGACPCAGARPQADASPLQDTRPHFNLKLANAAPGKVFGVVNEDDKSADYFAAATGAPVYRFSTKLDENDALSRQRAAINCELRLMSLESGAGGNAYTVLTGQGEGLAIKDNLPGAFNAGNVLAALIVVKHALENSSGGPSYTEIAALVPGLKPVRGRMTHIDCGQDFEVLVDYAHTPSSFETIFPPLRKRLDKTGGRIITLFGSAGERDTAKRPRQGAIASRYSDIVIITDEDPRGEEPMAICKEIAAGCLKERPSHTADDLLLIPNRPAAIRRAFKLARKGDLVLLLGKGHENSIIYKDHKDRYDEIAEAKRALTDV